MKEGPNQQEKKIQTEEAETKLGSGNSTATGSSIGSRVLTAESLSDRISSPTFRRLRAFAREQGSRNLEKILEIDVEEDGRNHPRVRVSSPHRRPKNPTHTPGNIQGRFKRVLPEGIAPPTRPCEPTTVRRRYAETPANGGELQGLFPGHRNSQEKVTAPRDSSLAAEIRKARLGTNQLDRVAIAIPATQEEGLDLDRKAADRVSPVTVALPIINDAGTQSGQVVPNATRRRSIWTLQQPQSLMAELRQVGTDMPPRATSEAGLGENGTGQHDISRRPDVDDDDTDDIGIWGLTVILHLRGKDDLVISTDLTRDVPSPVRSVM